MCSTRNAPKTRPQAEWVRRIHNNFWHVHSIRELSGKRDIRSPPLRTVPRTLKWTAIVPGPILFSDRFYDFKAWISNCQDYWVALVGGAFRMSPTYTI